MKKNKMSEKEKNILEIIIALLILTVFIGYRIYNSHIESREVYGEEHIVSDANRYFTAINCAKKFISSLEKGSANDILSILDSNYKNTNGINASNYRSFVPNIDSSYLYDYVGGVMIEKRISKTCVEYHIDGEIKKYSLNGDIAYEDYDLIVTLFENDLLFSVRPGDVS